MIKFFRSLIVLICIIIFGLGASVISFVLFPLGMVFVKKDNRREYFTTIIHYSWKFFTKIMIKFGCIKLHADGNFEDIKGKIVVASHPSLIDIVLLIGLIPKSVCIAKHDLLNNIILKNIVKNAYIINGIDTSKFIADAVDALQQGYNIIIFPTGTRTKKGENIRIHKGAAQLAISSLVDIVPIKIDCDYNFLQKNSSMLDAGVSVVSYNIAIKPTIVTSDYTNMDLTEIKHRNLISEQIKLSIN